MIFKYELYVRIYRYEFLGTGFRHEFYVGGSGMSFRDWFLYRHSSLHSSYKPYHVALGRIQSVQSNSQMQCPPCPVQTFHSECPVQLSN